MNTQNISKQIKESPNKSITKIILNKNMFDLFEDTLKNSISELLTQVADKYGDKYGFDAKDLIDEFLPTNELLVSVTTDVIAKRQSIKKNRRMAKNLRQQKKSKEKKHKCIARTWSGGKGLQCTRYVVNNKEYCGTHQNQVDRGVLWQGTINDIINKVDIVYQKDLEKIEARKNKKKQTKS